jgi:WD40 repeat protein
MLTDPWYTWIAYGTSNGCIEIYDFRFMLPIQRFQHRSRTSVVRLCAHPYLKNHLIATYQGNNELAIWNIETTMNSKSSLLKQSTNIKSTPELTFWGVQSVPPLCQKGITSEYISGIYGCTYDTQQQQPYGALICASTDMKIRYLDLNEPQRDSYLVSSPTNAPLQSSQRTTNDRSYSMQTVNYEMRQIEGSKVLVEIDQQSTLTNASGSSGNSHGSANINSSALAYQNYCTHHQDSITDLIVCSKQGNQSTNNQAFLVTTSRDGILKVWR